MIVGLIIALVAVLLIESGLRFFRLPLAPLRLRWLYACYLLNEQATKALHELHRRVEQAGVGSFDELFDLYASASGKSKAEIEDLFGLQMQWQQLLGSSLILRYHLQWHVGLVPVPGQQLRTISITSEGTRATGSDPDSLPPQASFKRVVMTGDSVAFGQGATSDAATIAGRLEYYLNEQEPAGLRQWKVVNYAFPSATSFQELIGILQHLDRSPFPDYVVSLAGCNDVDQQFNSSAPHVSTITQGYTNSLRRSPAARMTRLWGKRWVLVATIKRFVSAYRRWPGTDIEAMA